MLRALHHLAQRARALRQLRRERADTARHFLVDNLAEEIDHRLALPLACLFRLLAAARLVP